MSMIGRLPPPGFLPGHVAPANEEAAPVQPGPQAEPTLHDRQNAEIERLRTAITAGLQEVADCGLTCQNLVAEIEAAHDLLPVGDRLGLLNHLTEALRERAPDQWGTIFLSTLAPALQRTGNEEQLRAAAGVGPFLPPPTPEEIVRQNLAEMGLDY
jgi:hypothetical protein